MQYKKYIYLYSILIVLFVLFSFSDNFLFLKNVFADQTLIAQDTFSRANQTFWGTASDGNTWGADAASNNTFTISSNTGVITNPGAIVSGTLGTTARDAQAIAVASYTGTPDFGVILRYTDTNNWYKAYLDGSNLTIRRNVAGSNNAIASVGFTTSSSTSYTIKFQVVGDILYAKAWTTSGTEPTDWMLSVSDSNLTGAGSAGVQVANGVTTYTSFKAYSLTNITPTPSTTAGLSTDTFQRANQSHWGTASDGHAWGADAASNNAFTISSNTGVVTNPSSILAGTLGSTTTDGQAIATLSASGTTDMGVILRYTDANNWYKAYLDGSNLTIRKMVAGTNSVISSIAFTATLGTSYAIRFQVFGDVLSAKAWASAATEPVDWMLAVSDSALTGAGNAGIESSGTGTTTYTSFTAFTIATPTNTPTNTNTPTPTPTPTPTSSGSTNSQSAANHSSAPTCGDVKPTSPPNLFQISTSPTTATLYFSPVSPVTQYVISYGTGSNAEMFGATFPYGKSTGVVFYTISSLQSGATYSFKVRGGNGCMTGDWSQIVTATTTNIITLPPNNQDSTLIIPIPTVPQTNGQIKVSHQSQTATYSPLQTCLYTVQSGDSLWSIAQHKLGDGAKYQTIKDQNPNVTSHLFPGVQLHINCPLSTPQKKINTTFLGYDLSIRVVNKEKPVAGAIVELHSVPMRTVTDKEGFARFTNVEKGNHTIALSYQGYNGAEKISVQGDKKDIAVQMSVQLVKNNLVSKLNLVVYAVLLVIIFILSFFLFKKRTETKEKS